MMPSGAEVQRDRASGRETVLRLPWRCEPLHLSFPLTHGPGRVLGTIARIAMLPVLHTGLDLAHGCPGASQLIRDDDPWHVHQALEELSEESFRRCHGSVALH
jgi:hypothetical protein